MSDTRHPQTSSDLTMVVSQLLAADQATTQSLLAGYNGDELELAGALKARADHLLRADVQASLHSAAVLALLAEYHANQRIAALADLAAANAHSIGLGDYSTALELYDRGAATYNRLGLAIEAARAQIGRIWALACLGRHDEALSAGSAAAAVLNTHAQWQPLATLTMNLSAIHGRLGHDAETLALLDSALAICDDLGPTGASLRPLVEQNRAIVLRNLGDFVRAETASRHAYDLLQSAGQPVEAARALRNLAGTAILLGRYNEALTLLDSAREQFEQDGRAYDALVVAVEIGECLLRLRRFTEVLATCDRVRKQFSAHAHSYELAQVTLLAASAMAGLQRYPAALHELGMARDLFAAAGTTAMVGTCELERATIMIAVGDRAGAYATAENCMVLFREHGLPLGETRAGIVAALAADQPAQAHALAAEALAATNLLGVPELAYQCHLLLGRLAHAAGDERSAREQFDRAVELVERLRGALMVEFRPGYSEDKQIAYSALIDLCLAAADPAGALAYVERSRSRALVDLLAQRVHLQVQPRSAADHELVADLDRLRAEHDRLCRRREQISLERPLHQDSGEEGAKLTAIEEQITQIWHRLLIRNADYARDAAFWQARAEPFQGYLEPDTILLAYVQIDDDLVAFPATQSSTEAIRLPGVAAAVQRLGRQLQFHLRAAPIPGDPQAQALAGNARKVLQRLYNLLIAPLAPAIAGFPRLRIVSAGPLHYLPFHALHDGTGYLLERHAISYLPAASVLCYLRHSSSGKGNALVLGHSAEGRLPHILAEARTVAATLGCTAHLEEQATLAQLRNHAADAALIHLAAHGDFRADNPLFSGISLADGRLTTLDAFNLDLNADLVVLSACETGRSVVGGGDELIGLMRALLHAGAASLLLSHWQVEDRATAQIMHVFYQQLMQGAAKDTALQHTQQALISGAGGYEHPYYWAPFFLAGDPAPLSLH